MWAFEKDPQYLNMYLLVLTLTVLLFIIQGTEFQLQACRTAILHFFQALIHLTQVERLEFHAGVQNYREHNKLSSEVLRTRAGNMTLSNYVQT